MTEIVLRACSYDPKQRFSTAEEMRLALEWEFMQSSKKEELVPFCSISQAQQDDSGAGIICERGNNSQCEILPSTKTEQNLITGIQPEPEKTLQPGYSDEETVSIITSRNSIDSPNNNPSNESVEQAVMNPADDGTISLFGQQIATEQQIKQDINRKLCRIQFRDGYGNTISEIELSRGDPIVPPVVKNPMFDGWMPDIPPQARWDQVFVAQYKLHGKERNNSRYVEIIKITYLDDDGEYLDSRYYAKGTEVKHPNIPKVFQKEGRTFRGWEPDIKWAKRTTVCRACYVDTRIPKKSRTLGFL